jgi:hypothetical protein
MNNLSRVIECRCGQPCTPEKESGKLGSTYLCPKCVRIQTFIESFDNKFHLECDCADIVAENPAAEEEVKDALREASLTASEVLTYFEEVQEASLGVKAASKIKEDLG